MSAQAAQKENSVEKNSIGKNSTAKKSALNLVKNKGRTKAKAKSKHKVEAPRLSLEQVQQLVIDHRENGRKLARSLLNQWRVRMPAEEIYSIVDLTLCEAAKRYRPDKGASFMTFLYYHLRGQLVRAVASAANANQMFVSHAKNSGIDLGDWENYQGDALPTFIEPNVLGVTHAETPEDQLLRKEKIDRCRGALDTLDTLEQEVLQRAYENEQQLTDIARELGYSRCHISRVKRRALEQLAAVLNIELKEERADEPKASNARNRDSFRRRSRQRAVLRKLTAAIKLKRRSG